MLFNSLPFLFSFLPVVLGVVGWLYWRGLYRWIPGWLIAVSLWFYGDYRSWHLVVLAAELTINHLLAAKIAKRGKAGRRWLVAALALDLGILAWFKYGALLFADAPAMRPWLPGTLPLGISFYTFQIIAYLVDLYRGRAHPVSFREFALFILFFPQLIAGPIVHYAELIPQFRKVAEGRRKLFAAFEAGLFLFIVGLAKKVWLADGFARFADHAFDRIAAGNSLGFVEAWEGLLAYSLQIYFDFSAYSEMALGLGLMLGIRLPVNFLSPYRSRDFREFWRRWHITLSTFLRDYLYIPLGGSRKGRGRTFFNVVLVMTLAGAWHGSGWTFLLWGLGHGVAIVTSHLAGDLFRRGVGRVVGVALTFTVVTLLWVLFRSPSLTAAWHYYEALFAFSLPEVTLPSPSWLLLHWEEAGWVWVAAGLAIVWFFPSVIRIVRYRESGGAIPRPGLWYGIGAGTLLWIALKLLSASPAESFIYFMF